WSAGGRLSTPLQLLDSLPDLVVQFLHLPQETTVVTFRVIGGAQTISIVVVPKYGLFPVPEPLMHVVVAESNEVRVHKDRVHQRIRVHHTGASVCRQFPARVIRCSFGRPDCSEKGILSLQLQERHRRKQ
ncbi:MAG: hypothetical protein GY847_32320, partial [Proteobacteria bacterium]|nr:hypothetical protein [Pseudomonadota bacterium]